MAACSGCCGGRWARAHDRELPVFQLQEWHLEEVEREDRHQRRQPEREAIAKEQASDAMDAEMPGHLYCEHDGPQMIDIEAKRNLAEVQNDARYPRPGAEQREK